jgi:hypothetical protein
MLPRTVATYAESLYGDNRIALGKQFRDDAVPAGGLGERAVDEHDGDIPGGSRFSGQSAGTGARESCGEEYEGNDGRTHGDYLR